MANALTDNPGAVPAVPRADGKSSRESGVQDTPAKDKAAARSWLPVTHCLSLRVRVDQQFVGRVPGGYRVDLYYSGGQSPDPNQAPLRIPGDSSFGLSLQNALRQGSVLSGNDWVTINSETAFDFDSRITLALSPDGKVLCPVAGRLRGRAQIRDALKQDGSGYFTEADTAADVFARWQVGFDEDSCMPLVLSASFDVPAQGFDDIQNEVYKAARQLAGFLFIGRGKAIYRQGPYGDVKAIELDLFTVERDPVQTFGKAKEAQ